MQENVDVKAFGHDGSFYWFSVQLKMAQIGPSLNIHVLDRGWGWSPAQEVKFIYVNLCPVVIYWPVEFIRCQVHLPYT